MTQDGSDSCTPDHETLACLPARQEARLLLTWVWKYRLHLLLYLPLGDSGIGCLRLCLIL